MQHDLSSLHAPLKLCCRSWNSSEKDSTWWFEHLEAKIDLGQHWKDCWTRIESKLTHFYVGFVSSRFWRLMSKPCNMRWIQWQLKIGDLSTILVYIVKFWLVVLLKCMIDAWTDSKSIIEWEKVNILTLILTPSNLYLIRNMQIFFSPLQSRQEKFATAYLNRWLVLWSWFDLESVTEKALKSYFVPQFSRFESHLSWLGKSIFFHNGHDILLITTGGTWGGAD